MLCVTYFTGSYKTTYVNLQKGVATATGQGETIPVVS